MYLYTPCTLSVHYLHTPCTLPIHYLHTPCTLPIHSLYTTYTPPVHYLYITCTLLAHSLYITCTLLAHSLYITCTLPVHSLYIHSPYTPCILYLPELGCGLVGESLQTSYCTRHTHVLHGRHCASSFCCTTTVFPHLSARPLPSSFQTHTHTHTLHTHTTHYIPHTHTTHYTPHTHTTHYTPHTHTSHTRKNERISWQFSNLAKGPQHCLSVSFKHSTYRQPKRPSSKMPCLVAMVTHRRHICTVQV